MSDITHYESRTGRPDCSASEVFAFVTDLRNLGRFVHEGTISNWKADNESCSFSVSMIGTVNVRLTEKVTNKRVVYQGDALSKNDFTLVLHITGNHDDTAEVRVTLEAVLNPVMKMMAANPVNQFLEMLIKEIENFRDWNNIIV